MKKSLFSITLSLLLMANIISVSAATPAAKTEGYWYHNNSSFSSEGSNGSGGSNYSNMMLNHTKAYYVQTQDNEEFEVSNDLYLNKSSGINYLWINEVDTNKTNDTTINEGTWSVVAGQPDNTSKTDKPNEPNNVGIGKNVVGYNYSTSFTGNGAEEKEIEWNIDYDAGMLSFFSSNHSTDEDNENPLITIVVSDAREIVNKINEAEELLSYNVLSDEEAQALQEELDNIQSNYTLDGTEYYTQEELDNLSQSFEVPELKYIVPKEDAALALDRDNYDITGLEVGANSVQEIKDQLRNDGTQLLIFRNGVLLTEDELVGTGCKIQLVSKADPSIVYEEFDFILYGDVEGDGLVNFTDYEIALDCAIGFSEIEGLFAIAGDTNRDTVIDGFDCAQIELQANGLKNVQQ